MDRKIFNILKKINSYGYEAYLVGGYVRDFLLDKKSLDIDIATNATIESLSTIFKDSKIYEEFACIKFKVKEFTISITSYRKELNYENNKPVKIEYSESLVEDSLRRDFTINAIYMDKTGKLIDPQNGMADIKNKLIRVIGKTSQRLSEDTNRIIRAFKFMTILRFNLSEDINYFISKNKGLIKNINYERMKEELDIIFKDKNCLTFLTHIKENGYSEYFDLSYDKVIYCSNYLGIWAQIYYGERYNFSKKESYEIKNLKKLIKKTNISSLDIYNYGLKTSLLAAQILNIKPSKIKEKYNDLPIKKESDIKINYDQIEKLVGKEIAFKIYNKIKEYIIEGKLKNQYNVIRDYIKGGGFDGQIKGNN